MTPLAVARASLPLAVLLFAGTVIGDSATDGASLLALVPAGVLIVSRGVLMLRYRDTVMEPLAARERASLRGRTGLFIEHRFGASLLVFIGLGWATLGITYGM
jgi:hypothetical protein